MSVLCNPSGVGPGFHWDFDPNLTSEMYEDLGVGELGDIGEGEIKTRSQNLKNKNTTTKKALIEESKPAIVHSTPSPTTVGITPRPQTHIHNGQNCSCKRRILGSTVNEQPDYFSILSDEVILCIFRWLSKKTLTHCAKVCKRWRQLSYDDDLWKRVDLSAKNFSPGLLGMILRRGVVHVKLARSTIAAPVFMSAEEENQSAIIEENPLEIERNSSSKSDLFHLESLDLSACISDDPANIQSILERTGALKRLSLESCRVNGETLQGMVDRSASLQVLDLAMCRLSDASGLPGMLEAAQQLVHLNLSWINLTRADLQTIISKLSPGLKQLNLSGYREKLKDADVVALVTRCSQLEQLDLSDCSTLTSESIDAIVHNLTHLKHISLSRCYEIPMFSYPTLCELKTLVALDVFGGLQPRQVERLKAQMPKISINSSPFSAIARPTISAKCPHHIWRIACEE